MSHTRRQASLGTEFRRVWEEDKHELKLVLAKVIKVNPRFNTVDVESVSGKIRLSKSGEESGKFSAKLPVQFGGRTTSGQSYGQTIPVEIGTIVLVGFIESRRNAPVIISIYNDMAEAEQLSRSPVDGADPNDEELKKHTQHQFTVYPSLTYEDIDGEGNRTVSFTGKTFLSTESEVDPEIGGLSDDGNGTEYADLESSYYYSGELIEPKSGKAPNILFRHVGDRVDAQGNVIEDDHVTMLSLAQDGTFRTSVLKETEDWRSYFELNAEGEIRLRRQNDSKALGQGEKHHEIAITEEGILLRSGDKYMLFNQDGTSGNAGFGGGGGNYDADISQLKDGVRELSTNFEQTEEYIRMSARKVQEIEEQITTFESSFEIRAEQIELRVTETVTSLYDTQLKSISDDIKDLNESAEGSLDRLRELSDDGILSPLEKKTLGMEWDMIVAEYPNYLLQAELTEVDSQGYEQAYSALSTYLTPLLENTEVSSSIDRGMFINTFKSYYNSRSSLLYSVFNALKAQLDATAEIAIQAGKDASSAQIDATGAKLDADRANNLLSDIAEDGKATPQEKYQLRQTYRNILAEWESYVEQAEAYEIDSNNFVSAKDDIVSYIDSVNMFSDMTTTTVIDGRMLEDVFSQYYSERSKLLSRVTREARNLLLSFEGDLEHYETSITETAREIALVAQSVKLMGRDVELNRAEINIQADRIIRSVSRTQLYREIDENMNQLNSVGRNQFSETQSGEGELNETTGAVNYDRDDTKVSPYLRVVENKNYTAGSFGHDEVTVLRVVWYDKERNFLDSDSVSGAESPLFLNIISPDDAYYSRVSGRRKNSAKLLFELGLSVRGYKASPEDMVADLDTAREEWERRKDILEDVEDRERDTKAVGEQQLSMMDSISSDSAWTASEKQTVKTIFEDIEARHEDVMSFAVEYDITTVDLQGAYASLVQYVEPRLVSMTSISTAPRAIVNSVFRSYYTRRDAVYNDVLTRVRQSFRASEKILDEISESALEAQKLAERLLEEAEQFAREASRVRVAIREATTLRDSVMVTVNSYASDGVLTPEEKINVEQFLLDIAEEVPTLVTKANVHGLSTGDLTTAYSLISSYLSPMLTGDNKRQDSTINSQTFVSRFSNYFNAQINLLNNILDGANGKYESIHQKATVAQQEYRRRQDQMTTYQNVVIDSQFAVDRINSRIDEIENSVPFRLELESSNGTVFRDNNINSVLTARYFRGEEDITDQIPVDNFIWTKINDNGDPDTTWNNAHIGAGNQITITHEDVQRRAVFEVEVDL